MIVIFGGRPATGKSACMRTILDKYRTDGKDFSKDVGIFAVEKNRPPFRDDGKLMILKDAGYDVIMKVLKNPTLNCYVIDDSQFLMTHELFARCHENGYGKFTDMAKHFYDLLNWINHNVPEDVIVYFLHHADINENGLMGLTCCGKMLGEKYPIESVVNVILQSEVNQSGFFLRTKNRGTDIARAPMGMFEDELIPNDLMLVDSIIREYYGLKPITDHPTKQPAPTASNQTVKVTTAPTLPNKPADKKPA